MPSVMLSVDMSILDMLIVEQRLLSSKLWIAWKKKAGGGAAAMNEVNVLVRLYFLKRSILEMDCSGPFNK